MEKVRFLVFRDYGDRQIACAEFREEEDAREYYRWQKSRWDAETDSFVWKLCRCTDYVGTSFTMESLEG